MTKRARSTWYLYALALVGAALLAGGLIEIGAPTTTSRTSRQVLTAVRGVVQSTVTGSGNVAAGTDVQANFRTSGTLATVDVKVGQHVQEGQLLATLDPTADQLAVDQATQSLRAAQYQLTAAENGTSTSGSSGSSGSGSSGSSGSSGGSATGASTSVTGSAAQFVSATSTRPQTTPPPGKQRTTTPTRTTPTPSSPTPTTSSTTPTTSSTTPTPTRARSSPSTSTTSTATTATTTTTTPSPAAIASARASVDGAEITLRNADATLAQTRLYAPAEGTIVSLASAGPGDQVSAGSSSTSSGTGTSGTSSSGSSASTGSGSTTSGSLGGSSSSSSSSTADSSGFAEIVNTGRLTMTVAFSESDIAKVKVGQPATVTLDALSGVELGAHVSAISPVGTTSSSVVSYDATLTLDQTDPQVRPGMSASAAVITSQATGVNLPNSAVTGTGSVSTVNVLRNGKTVSTPVVVGLRGDSRTQIVSGLTSGAQVVVITTLPALGSSSTSSTSGTGTAGLRRALGGGGFGGAGFGGGGAGFGAGAAGGGG